MHTWPELWQFAADQHHERLAALAGSRRLTYGGLDHLIRSCACALQERLSIGPGDTVALVSPNCAEFVVAYLALIHAGAIALPINIRLKPPEMRFILEDAGVRTLIVHQHCWEPVAQALLSPAAGASTPPKAAARPLTIITIAGWHPGCEAFEQLCARPAYGFKPAQPRPDDVAAIIYTSGTTGLPKGAMLTHANIIFNTQSCLVGLGFRPAERHLLVVPLFHVTGLNTINPTSFRQGSTVVITPDPRPQEVCRLIEQHRVNTWLSVPTTLIMLTQTPGIHDLDLSSLRLIGYSGAPMPPQTVQRVHHLFPWVELHNFFGLTETTSMTSVLPAEDALTKVESVGPPVPGVEVSILDDAANPLPTGRAAELCIRGPNIFKGYLNRPDATKQAFHPSLTTHHSPLTASPFFRSGDLARLDADGYIYLCGRKKELIIVGAENVYPVEVENVLGRHPKVQEAAVVGREHPVLGEVVKAAVVLRPGEDTSELELKRWCAERLASFKVPQEIVFLRQLPRNPSGKVVKRDIP